MTEFAFRKGEPVRLRLVATAGDPADCTLTVKLKRANGQAVPPPSEASLGEFTPEFVAPTETDPAFWWLALPDDIVQSLPVGRYVTDALVTVGGAPAKVTRHVFITISASVSG